MVHILWGMEQDDDRFHNVTQNGIQIKIYELFLAFFIQYCGTWLTTSTENMESETTDKGALL